MSYIKNSTIIITGAGGGFGRLVAQRASALGAEVICVDIDEQNADATATSIRDAGGSAVARVADVRDLQQMRDVANTTVAQFGKIDAIVNNAGIMPLAFYADHPSAYEKWVQCIDINFKGVLNGIISAHDQMMSQGHGHIVNISSIYGNFPVAGAAVYGATKAAVNFLSEALRVESRGKIKVTIVKPTGVPGTGLSGGVVNPQAAIGIVGQNGPDYIATMRAMIAGELPPASLDPSRSEYSILAPEFVADQVVHALNQPRGISVGDITIRATGDHYIL